MVFRFKKSFTSLIILILFGLTACTQSKSTVYLSKKISSKILHQEINYSIYLPPLYFAKPTARFPVLYLLHGLNGDETSWIRRSNLAHIVDSLIQAKAIPQLIIVLPAAKNSYYINNFNQSFSYEDYFTHELIPYIDSNYRVLTDQKHKAIGGLSMGGFGALIIPIKHPELFGTSISLSAAVRSPELYINMSQDVYNKKFGAVFGDSLSGANRITQHWKENSPYFLVDSSNADTLKKINWFMDCGMQDFLYPTNDAFHMLLLKYNIPHEFHMRIGDHNWNYWHDGFISGMIFLGKMWK